MIDIEELVQSHTHRSCLPNEDESHMYCCLVHGGTQVKQKKIELDSA